MTDLVEFPGDDVEQRFRGLWPIALERLTQLYGRRPDFEAWIAALRRSTLAAASEREANLRVRGADRCELWCKKGTAIGYSAYVDRFGGDLTGVTARLEYLAELGVNYLHLLPLFRSRAGDSDGGFAISDFKAVEPRFGTAADFQALARRAHAHGVRIGLDLVVNHTADDHAWALAARSGDLRYRDYYHVLSEGDAMAYAASLSDVFPLTAPGAFTRCEQMDAWVWTTFYPFQWDLNYANPAVFAEMLDIMLHWANRGVDVFRLDSTPYLWKRLGTSCRNLPEAHAIVGAWRALLSIAAPEVLLKAEAIERLEDVIPYFGTGGAPECDLAYNNGVMTALWASLALGSAEPAAQLIEASADRPAQGTWISYVRCHDDIIWSSLSPHVDAVTQQACSRFFAGVGPRSFAKGRAFQSAEGDVATTNGMAAALVGVADDAPDSAAARRLLLLYGVAFALDGVPVIYMGDELALGNDEGFERDAARGDDGRWLHRPFMDWGRAKRRFDLEDLPGAIFRQMQTYAQIRASLPAFDGNWPARPTASGADSVLSFVRGDLQCLANFANQSAEGRITIERRWLDLLSGQTGTTRTIWLARYQVRWLVPAP